MPTTSKLLLNFMVIKTQLVKFVVNETCQKSKIRLKCACSVSTEQSTSDVLRHCRQLLTDDSYFDYAPLMRTLIKFMASRDISGSALPKNHQKGSTPIE